jgi:hypothetical protein
LYYLKQLTRATLLITWILAACSQSTPQSTSQATQIPRVTLSATLAGQSTPSLMGCTVVSRQPTPGPTEQALIPPVGEKDWVKGPDGALVTFIEYSDFQ